jgi:hypothetical protein
MSVNSYHRFFLTQCCFLSPKLESRSIFWRGTPGIGSSLPRKVNIAGHRESAFADRTGLGTTLPPALAHHDAADGAGFDSIRYVNSCHK